MHKLTVAICTYRRFEYLETCIESLRNQSASLDQFRLIIVDNSLQPKISERFKAKLKGFPLLDYYITEQAGIAFARTFAINHADTEYLAFIDDDALASTDWIRNMISAIERLRPKAGIIGGKVLPIWTMKKPTWLADYMLGALAVVDWGDKEIDVQSAHEEWMVSTNIAYNVEGVKKINGFRKELGRNQGNMICHEELDLHLRLMKEGYKMFYCPELIVNHRIHENRVNKEFMCDLMYSEGYSRALMEELEGDEFKHLFSIFENVLPPSKAMETKLFIDTKDPDEFSTKMGAISNLSRLLYHTKRVIERAPDYCFIPNKQEYQKVKELNQSVYSNSDSTMSPVSGMVTVNRLLPEVKQKYCDYINKIWLVIPCLNASKTIDETLTSIYHQKGNYELFLHIQDGGSTDDTISKVEKWESRFLNRNLDNNFPSINLSYISEIDNGLYEAINKGFEFLKVPENGFMSWLNADDILKPNALISIQKVAESFPNVHWLCGNRSVMNEEGEITWESDVCECSRYHIIHGACDNKHFPFVQQEGTFWRGWLWNEVGGVDSNFNLAGDYDLWIKFSKIAELYPLNQVLATFRLRSDSLSSNIDAYYDEVNTIVAFSERNEWCKNLVRLFSDGYIMLSPQIIIDNKNNPKIIWKNSIENIPQLKDDLKDYHQSLISDRKDLPTSSSNNKKTINIHALPKIPVINKTKWFGAQIIYKIKIHNWNKKQILFIKISKRFNTEWYLNKNVDVRRSGIDPIKHYVCFGSKEGRNPNNSFDSLFYLKQYSDVKYSGLNPFYHYLKYGIIENRVINSYELESLDKQTINSHLNPSNNNENLLLNTFLFLKKLKIYLTLFSSKLFISTYYLDTNPDVKDAKVNPLWHYINFGDKEGRKPNPIFDPNWYRLEYIDVAMDSKLNALYHFYKFGKMEERNPNNIWSTHDYLKIYPSLIKMKIHPLAHFFQYGIKATNEV